MCYTGFPQKRGPHEFEVCDLSFQVRPYGGGLDFGWLHLRGALRQRAAIRSAGPRSGVFGADVPSRARTGAPGGSGASAGSGGDAAVRTARAGSAADGSPGESAGGAGCPACDARGAGCARSDAAGAFTGSPGSRDVTLPAAGAGIRLIQSESGSQFRPGRGGGAEGAFLNGGGADETASQAYGPRPAPRGGGELLS